MTDLVRPTGDYAIIGGREYSVVARGNGPNGRHYVGLLLDEADDATAFSEVVERGAGDRMAKVGRSELERLERVTTTGTLDGEEVILYGLGDLVPCSFVGDPAWAVAHGFTGSPHDGWSGTVPLADIVGVRETVDDLLHPAEAGVEQEEIVNSIVGSLLNELALVEDPEWDSIAVVAAVTPEYADMTAYRYAGDAAGRATPLNTTQHQLFRDLQEATKGPDEHTWEVCVVKVDRDSARGSVNFVYPPDAATWRIDPADPRRLAENLRPRPDDFN